MRFVPPGGSGRSGKQMNDEPERYQGAGDGRTCQHSVPPKCCPRSAEARPHVCCNIITVLHCVKLRLHAVSSPYGVCRRQAQLGDEGLTEY